MPLLRPSSWQRNFIVKQLFHCSRNLSSAKSDGSSDESSKGLESHLRGRVLTHELGVPRHRLNFDSARFAAKQEGIDASFVSPDDHALKEKVKQFMINNFFVEAPIPKHIQITTTLDTNGLLHDEIDMLLNSGVSQTFVDRASGALAGASLNTVWDVDADYDAFPVKAVDWLNTGARIAEETCRTEEDVIAAWRSFQWQHIHHLFVGEARRRNKRRVFYLGSAFTHPTFRGKKLTLFYIQWCHKVAMQHDALACFLITIANAQDAIARNSLGNAMDIVDYAPYADLSLNVDRRDKSSNAFAPIKDIGGIVYLCAKN